MFTSIKDRLATVWRDDRALRWALGLFLIARVLYSAWALVIVALNPLLVSNLDLYGVPVVAAFDLRTSEHAAFSRVVGERALHFRTAQTNLTDAETSTVWDLAGRAVEGTYTGTVLGNAQYTTEDVYPYVGVDASEHPLLAPWQRFDTNWYLKIAERGYAADDGSTVYFPLYPLLIRVIGTLLWGHDLLAALIVSNAALVGVLYVAYGMTDRLYGPKVAARTGVYWLFFPTAFFMLAGYTESVFLLFALLALDAGMQSHWGRAGVFGAFAALTRLQGVLLVLPLAYLWWQAQPESKRDRRALAIALVPLATTAFMAWQYLIVGNASLMGAYEGQLHARFVMPWENLAATAALIAARQATFMDILNLWLTILSAGMLVVMWRRSLVPGAWLLYAALMLLAPLFRMTTTQPLVSMSRYVLVLLPVFVVWARWGNNPWMNRAILYLSFPLNLYLSAQFIMWGWVA